MFAECEDFDPWVFLAVDEVLLSVTTLNEYQYICWVRKHWWAGNSNFGWNKPGEHLITTWVIIYTFQNSLLCFSKVHVNISVSCFSAMRYTLYFFCVLHKTYIILTKKDFQFFLNPMVAKAALSIPDFWKWKLHKDSVCARLINDYKFQWL